MSNFAAMENLDYDIVIVGCGPIGIACGLAAQKNKLSYLILEKGTLVNSLYHYPNNMRFFSTSEKLEINDVPFISNNPKPTKNEALEYYRRIASSNELNIHLFEEVLRVDNSNDFHQIITNKRKYTSKYTIIATGFYDIPNLLNIPGEELSKVSHYYHDPHYYATQNIVIVGASNSAVDAALEIYRKGGNVSMIIRGSEIGERVKYWVKPDILNRIKEGSIKAYYNAQLKEIKEHEVVFEDLEGVKNIENDFVLVLTGYQPNLPFLKSMGIEISNDKNKLPQYAEDTMETNVSNLFLAGVICGGMQTHIWFIENSRIHAKLITDCILKKEAKDNSSFSKAIS